MWAVTSITDPKVVGSNPAKAMDFKNPQQPSSRLEGKAGRSHVVKFYGM
jgi:hypothetical protein